MNDLTYPITITANSFIPDVSPLFLPQLIVIPVCDDDKPNNLVRLNIVYILIFLKCQLQSHYINCQIKLSLKNSLRHFLVELIGF